MTTAMRLGLARPAARSAGRLAAPAALSTLAVTLALAACATTTAGEQPRVRGVDQFVVGVTMRADAERLLGPPQYQADEGEGRVALYWAEGPAGPRGTEGAARLVKLVFGPDARLLRPAETVYPSRLGGPALDGKPLEPAAPASACFRDADCPAGSACAVGACRRRGPTF